MCQFTPEMYSPPMCMDQQQITIMQQINKLSCDCYLAQNRLNRCETVFLTYKKMVILGMISKGKSKQQTHRQ